MRNSSESIENAIATVIESSQKHALATETGDYKMANKNYNALNKSIVFLIKEKELEKLEDLLTHEDISVKVWVASYLIRLGNQKAIAILEEIASKSIRHHSFDAKMVLQECRKGNLNL